MAENRESRGYGRGWKKLLAIYLVFGAAVYGLIYLTLQAGSGSGGGGFY